MKNDWYAVIEYNRHTTDAIIVLKLQVSLFNLPLNLTLGHNRRRGAN